MRYKSLKGNAPDVGFEEAVVRGLAPDRGLYYPVIIPELSGDFLENFRSMSRPEMALEVIRPFLADAIDEKTLTHLVEETLSFDFPLVKLDEGVFSLELYHGPTLAFKDVGARFMARSLGYFNSKRSEREVTVLVATSGDTGGAVADGFFGVEGVQVVILYPKGKVSALQELQLTTHGGNVRALEVDGTFDHCQAMVKEAFLDQTLTERMKLTSANSINVARWLPQMFYYFFAVAELESDPAVVFSVPSGNFGNICAGMLASKMGLPVGHFIAGTNQNDVVPEFLAGGEYRPRPSVATISNAMDVGAPSNFSRIQALYENDPKSLRANLSGYSYSDQQTRESLTELWTKYGYAADPHGAIGYRALKEYANGVGRDLQGVFLETAHPVKFLDVLPEAIASQVEVPQRLARLQNKPMNKIAVSNYQDLVDVLMG
jgi:threonine synthase